VTNETQIDGGDATHAPRTLHSGLAALPENTAQPPQLGHEDDVQGGARSVPLVRPRTHAVRFRRSCTFE